MASIAPPPTVEECCDLIFEHCQVLYDSLHTQDGAECNVDIDLQSTAILIGALDAPAATVLELRKRMQALRQEEGVKSQHEIIRDLQELCLECKRHVANTPSFIESRFHDFRIEEPRILPAAAADNQEDYAASVVWPDQMDARAYWFRKYFVAKPYVTLIGRTLDSVIIISVVKEKQSCKDSTRYRIIFRQSGGKSLSTMRHLVSEKSAEETEAYLESQGQSHFLDSGGNKPQREQQQLQQLQQQQQQQQRRRPLRSISSAIIQNAHHHHPGGGGNGSSSTTNQAQNRIMRAAIYSTHPNLDFRELKELSAESTVLAGLEKEILKFDEMEIPKFYKFGVLTVKDGQRTEEEWFSNSGLSPRFERFMNILGKVVELEGYQGYKAGLDTKSGESGKTSFASSWLDFEIMFHVAPLMPYKNHDKQQVHRKRYIGNDIVCIVFIDGDKAKFDPEVIRSQFLHVYIVVHPEQVNGKEAWRIQVISKGNVSECNPLIPSPAVFYDENLLKSFLLLKMINAENAALKSSEKLATPIAKARAGTLKALWETGIKFNGASTSNRNHNNELDDKRAAGAGERPKSAGAQRISRGSMRSLRSALISDHPPRSITPDIPLPPPPPPPPAPASSRSSMLREWKKLGRRRSSAGCTSSGEHQSPVPSESSGNSSRGTSPLLVVEVPEELFQQQQEKKRNVAANNKDTIRQFTYLPRPIASHQISRLATTNESTCSNHRTSSNGGGIRSRAQNLVTSVMGRRPGNNSNRRHQKQQREEEDEQQEEEEESSHASLIRSKTFMLDHAGRLIHQGEK